MAAAPTYGYDRAPRSRGVKEMLVAPISFVTEHIETLHEIKSRPARKRKKLGHERFRMMPAVGASTAIYRPR